MRGRKSREMKFPFSSAFEMCGDDWVCLRHKMWNHQLSDDVTWCSDDYTIRRWLAFNSSENLLCCFQVHGAINLSGATCSYIAFNMWRPFFSVGRTKKVEVSRTQTWRGRMKRNSEQKAGKKSTKKRFSLNRGDLAMVQRPTLGWRRHQSAFEITFMGHRWWRTRVCITNFNITRNFCWALNSSA